MKTVEDQVRYLVWEQCRYQVGKQVRHQAMNQVGRGFVFLDLMVWSYNLHKSNEISALKVLQSRLALGKITT
jgi:hypothetical protein